MLQPYGGYSRTTLRRAFNKANAYTRTSLHFAPSRTTGSNTVKVITKFSAHHGQLCNILGKHWHFLQIIISSVNMCALRNWFSDEPNHLKTVWWVVTRNRTIPPALVQEGRHKVGITGVIYLMLCERKAFYVGKTIRELRQRIRNHIYFSTNGKLTTIGRHIIGLY